MSHLYGYLMPQLHTHVRPLCHTEFANIYWHYIRTHTRKTPHKPCFTSTLSTWQYKYFPLIRSYGFSLPLICAVCLLQNSHIHNIWATYPITTHLNSPPTHKKNTMKQNSKTAQSRHYGLNATTIHGIRVPSARYRFHITYTLAFLPRVTTQHLHCNIFNMLKNTKPPFAFMIDKTTLTFP